MVDVPQQPIPAVLERSKQFEVGSSKIDVQVLLSALKACSRIRNLERGKQLHAEAVKFGHDSNVYVVNALINMYGKCGSISDARKMFDGLNHPDVVSWTGLISGYADNGKGQTALDLFSKMRSEGPSPDSITLVAVLKACTSLAVKGANRWDGPREIHNIVVENGCNSDVYVRNSLIDMYAKCGNIADAREIFDTMNSPDVVSWTALISGYAANGQGRTALNLFIEMRNEGTSPNYVTFVAAFKACISLTVKDQPEECIDLGEAIHNIAVESGVNSNGYVQSILVDMYAKCGSMLEARHVFDGMKHPDVVSWNTLILGYVENGQSQTSLDMLKKMRTEGPAPSSVTLVAVLKAYIFFAVKEGSSRWVECRERGKEIHNLAVENDCTSDVFLQSTFVDLFAKCGSMVDARTAFDSMKQPNIVSWTGMIFGYAENGQGRAALDMFSRMKTIGLAPDSVTLVAALKGCTSLALEGASQWPECRERAKAISSIAVEYGCNSDVYVQSTLVDMYAKCVSMVDARDAFDSMKHPNVVSWTALIMGYADNEQGHIALDMFSRMRTEGLAPNSVTLVAALKASTSLAAKEGCSRWAESRDRGKDIHNIAVKCGCMSDVYVQNSLIDMYAKCSSMKDAREVFDSIKYPAVVSWNVLVLGYTENGQGRTALKLFTKMRAEGVTPDGVTFVAALKACSLVGALEFGRSIHSEIDCLNDFDIILVNCLVDFYAKCGSMVEAQRLFDLHVETRNGITWTSLLAGFSSCGDNETVFGLFERMQDGGFKPDDITFLCVLTCCSRASLVVKGKECFDTMSIKYGINPTIGHYNCMIDLLGRANKLDEALALLKCMPCSPNDVTWMAVLGACRKWQNLVIGRLAFESLVDLNDKNAAAYVLMGQIYKSKGMLQQQEVMMRFRKELKASKVPGETCWTNEAGDVHTFFDDNRHPQIHEIPEKWKYMMHIIADKEFLSGHSEILALVCALINTEPGKTIRIVKNKRVCDDCHPAIALVSKLECRTLICRDASRIHVFKDGMCSCGEFS